MPRHDTQCTGHHTSRNIAGPCLFCDDPAVDRDEHGQALCEWHWEVWAEALAKAEAHPLRRLGEQER